MSKYSFGKKGLSMSAAQSLSNVCFQKQQDIDSNINKMNCIKKTILINGKESPYSVSMPIPTNIDEVLTEKAKYASLQAFLMEHIKAKGQMLTYEEERLEGFMVQGIERPIEKDYLPSTPKLKMQENEQWGWEQLTPSEYNEYLDVEAKASHIGQFIHKNGKLEDIRKNAGNTHLIEWIEINKGEKTPIFIEYTSSSEDLNSIHSKLSNLHRKYEQKVNYYKAKVKNLVNEKNQEILKENKEILIQHEQAVIEARKRFNEDMDKYNSEYNRQYSELQSDVMKRKQEIANIKIIVPEYYQPLVDELLAE